MTLYLSQPAMLSAIGNGINIHLDILLNNGDSPLTKTDFPYTSHQIDGQSYVLGKVVQEVKNNAKITTNNFLILNVITLL